MENKKIKIVVVNGSPKKKSSTQVGLDYILEECKKEGCEVQEIRISDYNFSGCIDCGFCRKNFNCSQNDDFTNKLIPILKDDSIKGFIFASPVYFGGITSQLKAFFDRSVLFRRNGFFFNDKVAGALTIGASRNGGQELAAMDIIKNALIQGMIVVPDEAPTSHFGANMWRFADGGIEHDEIGEKMARNLGKKISKIVKKINS